MPSHVDAEEHAPVTEVTGAQHPGAKRRVTSLSKVYIFRFCALAVATPILATDSFPGVID